MVSDQKIIARTEHWLRSFVIELNICPFAKREVERGTVRIQVIQTLKRQEALEELIMEIVFLDKNPSTETTLLIFPSLCNDFFQYLDFVELAELLMREQGYEGVYQLATFHPDYCFADSDFNDVANYTNRSPYPMLHLLREDSLDKAIDYYGVTESIPAKNIVKLRSLGLKKIEAILAGL